MNLHWLQCPTCGQRLAVGDNAPPFVTCPKCLGRIGIETRPVAAEPIRINSLESQAKRDGLGSRVAAVVLPLVIALGVDIATVPFGPSHQGGFMILVAVLAGLAAYLFVASPLVRDRKRSVPPTATAIPAQTPTNPRVLNYRAERKPPRVDPALQALLGFTYVVVVAIVAVSWSSSVKNMGWISLGATGGPAILTLFFRETRGFSFGSWIATILIIVLPVMLLAAICGHP